MEVFPPQCIKRHMTKYDSDKDTLIVGIKHLQDHGQFK